MPIFMNDVQIINCKLGVDTNVPIVGENIQITDCETGLNLQGEAENSRFLTLEIRNCVQGIVVSAQGELPQQALDSLVEALGSLDANATQEQITDVTKRSGFGRWARDQKFTDWASLSINLGRFIAGG